MKPLFENIAQVLNITHWTTGYFRQFATVVEKRKYKTIEIQGELCYFRDEDEHVSNRPYSKYAVITLEEAVSIVEKYDPTHRHLMQHLMHTVNQDLSYTDIMGAVEYVELISKAVRCVTSNTRGEGRCNLSGLSWVPHFDAFSKRMYTWVATRGYDNESTPLSDTGFYIDGITGNITVSDVPGERYFQLEVEKDREHLTYVFPRDVIPQTSYGSSKGWGWGTGYDMSYHYDPADSSGLRMKSRLSKYDSQTMVEAVIELLNRIQKISTVEIDYRQELTRRHAIVIFDGYFVDNTVLVTNLVNYRLYPELLKNNEEVTIENVQRCIAETVVLVGTVMSDNLRTLVTQLAKEVITL